MVHVGYIGHNSERHDLICRYCSFGADGAGGHPAVQLHPRTAPVCDDKKKMNLMCQTVIHLSHGLISSLSCHNSKHIQHYQLHRPIYDLYGYWMKCSIYDPHFYHLNCVKRRIGVMDLKCLMDVRS